MTKQTDVFLTHDWGTDENGRNNHARVSLVNAALKQRGYITWFDEEKMEGNINHAMAQGIENTHVVLVFVTKRYMEKLASDNEADNCKKEFNHAEIIRTGAFMLPVVMEKRMTRGTWKGKLGLVLGGVLNVRMFFDFSDEAKFNEKMEEMARLINMKLAKAGAAIPYTPTEVVRPQPSVAPVTEGSSKELQSSSDRKPESSGAGELQSVQTQEGEKTRPETSTAVCNQRIPNLFHEYGKVKRGTTVEMTIDNAASISRSLFMVLEYMDLYAMQVTDSVLEKLVELRRKNNWTRVHPEFVDTLTGFFGDARRNKLKNSADITSSTHSVRVVCDKVTTMYNFLTKSDTYSFKIRLPGQPVCDNEQEFGFLIEITGVSPGNQKQFDVQLVGETNRNPTDMQLADKLHLVVERQYSYSWNNLDISWYGRPVYRDDGYVGWACNSRAEDTVPVRLVAYYSVCREQ